MIDRPLTHKERDLVASVFGRAIDCDPVRIRLKKWWPFQPRNVVMAPLGHMHFHPDGPHYREDFGEASLESQGLFIHEMVHVWQHQSGIFLPLRRHPFCRYTYALKPGLPFHRYGLEQQAEIVRHWFLIEQGRGLAGAPGAHAYRNLVPFTPGSDA